MRFVIKTDVVRFTALALAVLLSAACNDSTLPWELDHNRIIVVRATPPQIAADAEATLDILLTTEAGEPAVVTPISAAMISGGPNIGATVRPSGDGWAVVAPDQAAIDSARGALGLAADEPVPVRVSVTVEIAGEPFSAIKTVYVGREGENPRLGEVTIAGAPARDEVVIPVGVDVVLGVASHDSDEVDWLTSVGDLEDDTDTVATLYVDEAARGMLALVIRDEYGGVVWGLWTLQVAE